MGSGRKPVAVGDTAPDFELESNGGEVVKLRDFRGSPVVVFFYPKDNTLLCTKEACAFRDTYEAFQEHGAKLVGISSDSVESHQAFAAEHRLTYPLLSDPGGEVRRLYGVPRTLGMLPGRVTYVIDAQGAVRHVFNSQTRAQKHVSEALRIVDLMAPPDGEAAAGGRDASQTEES